MANNPFTANRTPNPFFQQAYEFADAMLDRLAEIHREIEESRERRERARTSLPGESNAAGVAEVIFYTPPGWDWLLERVSLTAPPGASCNVYLDNPAPQNLLETISRAELYADAFANNLYIPQGRRATFQFTGCGANREVFVGLQLSRYAPQSYAKIQRYDIESA